MELEEDLAHDTDLGSLMIDASSVELGSSLFGQMRQLPRTATLYGFATQLQILVLETLGNARLTFTHGSGVIEFCDEVAVKHSIEGDDDDLAPRHIETGLYIAHVFAKGETDDGHLRESRIDKRLLDERDVVGGTALSTRLRHDHSRLVGVVATFAESLDEIAHHEGSRIADLVVGITQTHIARNLVAERQTFQVEAHKLHDGWEQRRDELCEIGCQNLATTHRLIEDGCGDKLLGLAFFCKARGQLERLDERTDAKLHRPHVVDVVEFEESEALVMANHQVANLIDKEGIGTAAERSELHEMHIVALLGTPLGSLQNACGIGPLGNVMHVVEVDILVANIVVGDDVDAHTRNQVGHLVLDERVAVIGTAHKHDDQAMVVASFAQHILAEVSQALFEEILRIDCLIDGIVDLLASFHAKVFQQLLTLLAQQLFILERDGRRDEFSHGTLH